MYIEASTPSFSWPTRWFWTAFLINTVWINASEVWRYFVYVMPMMRTHLSTVPDVAPMNLGVFAMWGVWDTILIAAATGYFWMFFRQFGSGLLSVLVSATTFWGAVFVIFWLAMFNMNLASPSIALTALPFAWLELAIAAAIVRYCFARSDRVAVGR